MNEPEQLADLIVSGDVDAARLILDVLGRVAEKTRLHGPHAAIKAVRRIAKGSPAIPLNLLWRQVAKRLVVSVESKRARSLKGPWERKADNILICLRLRGKDAKPPSGERFKYKSTTWDDCVNRLYMVAHSRTWRGRSEPWVRWAATVTKNINRRWEGRYAKGKAGHDQGSRDSRDDRGSGLSLCV